MSKVITKIVSKNSSKEKKAVSKGKIITDWAELCAEDADEFLPIVFPYQSVIGC